MDLKELIGEKLYNKLSEKSITATFYNLKITDMSKEDLIVALEFVSNELEKMRRDIVYLLETKRSESKKEL